MTLAPPRSFWPSAWTALLAVAVVRSAVANIDPVTPRDSLETSSTSRARNASASVSPAEEFPVPLGSFSTTLVGSVESRTANVRLAVAALDGEVLDPGEVLSFNRAVGPRSTERGYQVAPVILHQMRGLQVGGGVCQVSSTLFVAALLSGLDTVERHRHSSPVDYIPLGQDATIAWGAKDLQLRNHLAQRVRLRVEVVGATLIARFEGQEPLGDVFELETEEHEIPGDPASGFEPGREIEVYRLRRTAADREFLHRDRFPPYRATEAARTR
jgi:hypothetical protein